MKTRTKLFFLWALFYIPIIVSQLFYINTELSYFGFIVFIYPLLILIAFCFAKNRRDER